MEATVLSIGKSVLNGALGYTKSAVVQEMALQLGIQRDQDFVTAELEMMQYFLMDAHEERDGRVIKIWVKQVRDVAYDVEDCLQDFVVRLQTQSWWHIPRMLLDRRHVAKQMKELRAKVEDVSQRNMRYRLINGSNSISISTDAGPSSTAAMFGIDEARLAAKQRQPRLDLAQLINKDDGGEGLGVIALWGTSGSVGHTSVIWEAYENPNIKLNFPCRAWVRVMHPFHPKEFVQSIVKQFRAAVGVGVLLEEERTGQDLAQEFDGYVNEKRYLIVLTDISTIEEWQQISICFPLNKNQSCVIVSSEQVEVASLCAGQASLVSELKQLSAHQTIYAFYQQGSQDVTFSTKACVSISNSTTTISNITMLPIDEIHDNQSKDADIKWMVKEKFPHTSPVAGVLEEFQLTGREAEKIEIMKLISKEATQQFEVIAVWGMGGLGKTTLVKDVYQRQELNDMFARRAFVTVLRPFKLEELLRTLATQVCANAHEKKSLMNFAGDQEKDIASMTVEELIKSLDRLSAENKCLIVLDDLSSTMEWDIIMQRFLEMKKARWTIVITTRQENIAKHCCKNPEYIRLLNGLQDKDAYDLFTNKVFKKTTDLAKQYPELVDPAKLILKKCNGLPLAVVTIGGFLADQPSKTAVEWRKLNEHISAELEMNPKLEPIKSVLMKSYDGLPYYLKACFLYLSIFPEDHKIRLRRLAYRWIAEGYSREVRDKSAVEIAERYFVELIERSMILPIQQSASSRNRVDSCQLHDLIRDISISKSMEENLVFRLEAGCGSNTRRAVRHLAISSNWEGDECDFQSTVELSRIRSLTVFGKWRPFYILAEKRFLRVLDLEDTKGLANHDIECIGKLLHLRHLSLRGCNGITYLPNSVGNLSQLETLDIKDSGIVMLPKTIIKLSKLRYVHAGSGYPLPKELNWCKKCLKLLLTPFYVCALCCSREPWRDACASGVMVPRGTRKLKALHRLRYVHLAWGNAAIEEIKGLTGLRKLGVVGIDMNNGLAFCSAISSLSHLESLSVQSGDGLIGCLDGMSTAPENLQSLKLSGSLEILPEWIKGLQNLVKLSLQRSSLSSNCAAMHALGNLPNLSILGLWEYGPKIDVLRFENGLFRRLTVLTLCYESMEIKLVEFEEESMPNLEMLDLDLRDTETAFSGLEFLQSIKEIRLSVYFSGWSEDMTREEMQKEAEKKSKLVKDKVRKELRIQLDRNKNRPVLKVK